MTNFLERAQLCDSFVAQMFDEDGEGEINEAMLNRVCTEIGIEMPEKTIKGMIGGFIFVSAALL